MILHQVMFKSAIALSKLRAGCRHRRGPKIDRGHDLYM